MYDNRATLCSLCEREEGETKNLHIIIIHDLK
jgi:hypothetical protein